MASIDKIMLDGSAIMVRITLIYFLKVLLIRQRLKIFVITTIIHLTQTLYYTLYIHAVMRILSKKQRGYQS